MKLSLVLTRYYEGDSSLDVDSTAQPKFHKPCPAPYSLRTPIKQDLKCLEESGVREKVTHSDWAAPIVSVPKPDGSVRICGNYKVTMNPVLKVDQYPLPSPEDLFAMLPGGKVFTKLDVTQAYQQVLLWMKSQEGSLPLIHMSFYIGLHDSHLGLYLHLPFFNTLRRKYYREYLE